MREKLLSWSSKSFVALLMVLAGLMLADTAQAQALTTTPTVSINWITDVAEAKNKLDTEIRSLEATMASPLPPSALVIAKHKHWYFVEIRNALETNSIPESVEIGQNKVGAAVQPDTPNLNLPRKDLDDIFQSAITLLSN